MKKILFAAAFLTLFALQSNAQHADNHPVVADNGKKIEGGIQWITWEQATELNKTKPKKFVIDVFTEWCGWCKKMDREIFTDATVAKFVSENYYAVKLDAEQKTDIIFNNHTFKFVQQGRSGFHEFAATLLDNNMGYPTLVYLSEKYERTVISPGYKDAPTLMKELKFTAEEHYKKGTWDEYMSKGK